MAGRDVGDQRGGDAVLHQFPGRQSRALQPRTGLVRVDLDALARLDRRADHAQRRAVAGGRERAGVAVREDALPSGTSSAPSAPRRRFIATSSAMDCVSLAEERRRRAPADGRGPARRALLRMRRSAHARFTAVGRLCASRSIAAAIAARN